VNQNGREIERRWLVIATVVRDLLSFALSDAFVVAPANAERGSQKIVEGCWPGSDRVGRYGLASNLSDLRYPSCNLAPACVS
jgi:hypothetical protein